MSSPRSILLRLILPFASLIALVVGSSSAVVYWVGQRNVHLQEVRDLDRLVRLVRSMMTAEQISESHEQIQRIKDLAATLDTRITLIRGDGTVLLDTSHDPATMENHNTRPEVQDARAEAVGSAVRRSDTINEQAVYVAQLLDKDRPNGMVVRLSYPEHVWARLGVPAWTIVLAGAATATLVMAVLAMLLQRRWIGPVRELASAADEMSAGNWQTRVNPAGADAIRFLGNRFNVMAAQAQNQLAVLNHQRADLQSLVDSLPDPVLLSDAEQRIAVINAPAARLLQLTTAQAVGKKIVGVVNEEAILRALEDVQQDLSGNVPVLREMRIQRGGTRTTYHAVAMRAQSGGVLLVLRNVSTMAAAVQMKTDFVANASHELRTPIAAIKSAFETLQEVYSEDPEQASRCMTIIGGHLTRLEEMLSDLLDLSRVESPDIKTQITRIRIDEIEAWLQSSLGAMARTKQVELISSADGWSGEREFDGDRRLLGLILKNLVENSLKFTPPGGQVTVRFASPTPTSIAMSVSDSGIGIPPEHRERVFERFYQVDSARSGSAGRGTGLGLAIVKHAAHALEGTIELVSEVGVGTTVTCIFPRPASGSEDAV